MQSATTDQQPQKFAYRPSEAAKLIGIGLTNIRARIASGELASIRIGKCVLVTPEAIAAFLASAAKGGA